MRAPPLGPGRTEGERPRAPGGGASDRAAGLRLGRMDTLAGGSPGVLSSRTHPAGTAIGKVSTSGENSVHLERKEGKEPNGENAGDRVEEEARHLVAHEAACTASRAAATRAISDPGPTSSVKPRLAHTGRL
ncbi:unnamed protein product [Rangifer tarandus platyrhynchus]|uniref:Uncharacterized protein n=1 Tax=Rangifer tarandus platyrhynchus TaxID=3082113 RepID=A0AC59Z2L8_RANTA